MQDLFGTPTALREASPATAAALDGLAAVVDADGELPRWFKHLLVACVAALKRREDETHRWVRSAVDAGAPPEAVVAIAIDATLSRGVSVAADILGALAAAGVAPPSAPSAGQLAIDTDPDADAIRAYFTGVFGAVPDRVALLMDHCFPAMAAYHLMRQAGLEDSVLPGYLLELVLVTLNAAEYQPVFVEVHALGARQKGASEAQLVEACVCAIPLAGVAAWLPASQGILASRPDPTGG